MTRVSQFVAIAGISLVSGNIFAYPPSGPMSDGGTAWVQGDLETARREFSDAAGEFSTRVNAWYNLGYLHFWQGRLDSAKALMTQALTINPDFAPAHYELGKMAWEEGKVITAREHLEQAVSIPYASFRVWQLLGESRLALGDTAGARYAFDKSLDNHPGYHPALESLAQMSLADQDTLSALLLLDKACHDSPAPAAFEKYLALLEKHGDRARFESVRRDFRKRFPELSQPTKKSPTDLTSLFPVGERLEYSFRWEFLKLGSAILTITGWDTLRGESLLALHIDVQSAPAIIVVNVQDQYDAWIDPVTGICHRFRFHMNSTGVDLIGLWDYQYADQQYVSRTVVDDGYIFGIRQPLPAEVTDGPSLTYHFRYMVKTGALAPVLFVLDDEYHRGVLYREEADREFAVNGAPVTTNLYQGELNCRGIVGLSGDFDAWFSEAPGPLLVRAEARIFLGSIKIALVEYSP